MPMLRPEDTKPKKILDTLRMFIDPESDFATKKRKEQLQEERQKLVNRIEEIDVELRKLD